MPVSVDSEWELVACIPADNTTLTQTKLPVDTSVTCLATLKCGRYNVPKITIVLTTATILYHLGRAVRASRRGKSRTIICENPHSNALSGALVLAQVGRNALWALAGAAMMPVLGLYQRPARSSKGRLYPFTSGRALYK